jgi:hypothetical protein
MLAMALGVVFLFDSISGAIGPAHWQEGAAINLHIHPHLSHKRAVPIGSGSGCFYYSIIIA